MPTSKAAVRPSKADGRQHLIRLVHIARRDLGMETDTYRAALLRATGKDSCSAMSKEELQKALDHLKLCGFKVRAKPAPSRALDQSPMSSKIRALWLLLHEIGAVSDPSEAALGAYCKRITGVEALQWTDGKQCDRLIETMKKWAMRYLPDLVKQRATRLVTMQFSADRETRLKRCLATAFTRGTFDPMLAAWDECKSALATANGDGNGSRE